MSKEFLPNPKESIAPKTERDAYLDAIQSMGILFTEEKLREYVSGTDIVKVVEAVQGIVDTKRPLNPVEMQLTQAVFECNCKGLVRSPIWVSVEVPPLSRSNLM